MAKLKVTLKLFTTGSITLTAPSVKIANEAIKEIYPLLLEYKRTYDQSQNSSQSIKLEPVTAMLKTEPSLTLSKTNLDQTNEAKQHHQTTQITNFTSFNCFNNNVRSFIQIFYFKIS